MLSFITSAVGPIKNGSISGCPWVLPHCGVSQSVHAHYQSEEVILPLPVTVISWLSKHEITVRSPSPSLRASIREVRSWCSFLGLVSTAEKATAVAQSVDVFLPKAAAKSLWFRDAIICHTKTQ